jgi:hypothetical protein
MSSEKTGNYTSKDMTGSKVVSVLAVMRFATLLPVFGQQNYNLLRRCGKMRTDLPAGLGYTLPNITPSTIPPPI